MRGGEVDIETGVIDLTTAPEMRAVPLFEDRWVGVVRDGHMLSKGTVTATRYARAEHVHVLRRGLHSTDIDDAVNAAGPERPIAVIVQGFSAAIALARETDLVATVPERHTAGLRKGCTRLCLARLGSRLHALDDLASADGWRPSAPILRGHIRSICAREAAVRR